jgi:ribosomal protein S18 acetylase RimI-like enzyme
MSEPVSLSDKNISSAISLIDKIFLYKEDRELARINFIETLEHKNYGQSYWFATDGNGKVIGMTGLYLDQKNRNDKSNIWLGWFGVHPDYRRRGIGSSLLQFSINEAKSSGFKTMKIYTSTDENELAAHKLYNDHGFKKIEQSKNTGIIYYLKNLDELVKSQNMMAK